MATVELKPVVIWYAVTPEGVEARVRTYAGGLAVLEESHRLTEDDLAAEAVKRGAQTWGEADICAKVPQKNGAPLWAGSADGLAIIQDIAPILPADPIQVP